MLHGRGDAYVERVAAVYKLLSDQYVYNAAYRSYAAVSGLSVYVYVSVVVYYPFDNVVAYVVCVCVALY